MNEYTDDFWIGRLSNYVTESFLKLLEPDETLRLSVNQEDQLHGNNI